MQRRFEEMRRDLVADAIEGVAGRAIPGPVRRSLRRGADELDRVRSGRDDTTHLGLREIDQKLSSSGAIRGLRTAAFAIAIENIARSYRDLGIY